MPDLIDQTTLIAYLADNGLTDNQVALLPAMGAAASRRIRSWCNRYFNRRPAIDELYAVDPGQPLILREYPVNGVARIAGGPAAVLTIRNADAATNQRASVRLAATGDADAGLVPTGLTLSRLASGTTLATTLPFADHATLASLAAAIAALGGGWTATADPDRALWPTADLRAPMGALPALARDAALLIHVDDLAFDLDESTGIVHLADRESDPFDSHRWGVPLSTGFGDPSLSGRPLGVRVIYDAGFDVVPEEVQGACAEYVWDMLNTLLLNPRIESERIGDYGYNQAGMDAAPIPPTVLGKLSGYRDTRA